MAAKGFIAQASAKGYDANTAVMDLLATHGIDITTPLNVNAHNFLVLFKEAAGLMIIPFPTVLHNLADVINEVNGDALVGALGNNIKNLVITTRMTETTMAAAVAMATVAATAAVAAVAAAAAAAAAGTAAANALTEQITAAAAVVTHATS